MPVLLELRSLGVAIGRTALLHDVSVQLAAGEAIALVGASGSGKTTLLRGIMGLLPPQAILTGERRWQGRDLFGFSHAEWRLLRGRGIGWIPQEPLAALDPRRTATQHLRECLVAAGQPADPASLARAFEAVGLDPGRADAYPHQWSGGMQQRLLVAMALVRRPALLLADEATSALDALHQAQLLLLLRRLRAERGFALLWVTHDLAVAAAVAERVVVLSAGSVVEQGSAAAVFSAPRHPATAALVAAQPRLVAGSGA